MVEQNYIHLNEAVFMIVAFYLVLFYVLNFNTTLNLKHKILVGQFILPSIFFFLFCLSFLLPTASYSLGLEVIYHKKVLLTSSYSLFFSRVLTFSCFIFTIVFRLYYMSKKLSATLILDFLLVFFFFYVFSQYLILSIDLGFSFICLEGVSMCIYILLSYPKDKVSIEVASIYMWFSVMSSALMICGIGFIFTITRSLKFYHVEYVISKFGSLGYDFIVIGFSFILFSSFIKLAAFPFHMWSFDVYEGSWSPVTFIVMVFLKLVFISFFFKFWFVLFPMNAVYYKYLIVSAVGCFFYGTFGSIRQTTIKRILAYTSMNQTAFFFLGLLAGNIQGFFSSLFHILVYLLTLFLFFLLFFISKYYNNNTEFIFNSDFTGLGKKLPILSLGFTVVFLSLAGIPPMLGFFTKFFITVALVNSNHYFLTLFSLLMSVVVSFVYLRFIKIIWFDFTDKKFIPISGDINIYFLSFLCFFLCCVLCFFLLMPTTYLQFIYENIFTSLFHLHQIGKW